MSTVPLSNSFSFQEASDSLQPDDFYNVNLRAGTAQAVPAATSISSQTSSFTERAISLYQSIPAGTLPAVAIGAVAYYASSNAYIAALGGLVGFVLQSFAHSARLQPLFVKLLQDAGLKDLDLQFIDMSALTHKMAPLSDNARKNLVSALATLKSMNCLNKENAAATIAAKAPLELAQVIGTHPTLFFPGQYRAALIASANPQMLAEAFSLLMTASILDKDNNFTFTTTVADLEAFVRVLKILVQHNILGETTVKQVKISRNFYALAVGLDTLAEAQLLKPNDGGLFSKKQGLLDGLTGSGPTKNGECFQAVIQHTNPQMMGHSLARLAERGLLRKRENFLAVTRSQNPLQTAEAILLRSKPLVSVDTAFQVGEMIGSIALDILTFPNGMI